MRRSLFLLGATTAIAAASAVSELNLPDTVPQDTRRLLQRQTPGTPQYDCHANCGGVITISRTADYCKNDSYKSQLKACLTCALTYDIWKYYSSSVSKAAQACGDDATPAAGAPAVTASSVPDASAPASSAPAPAPSSGAPAPAPTSAASSVSGLTTTRTLVPVSSPAPSVASTTTTLHSATSNSTRTSTSSLVLASTAGATPARLNSAAAVVAANLAGLFMLGAAAGL